MATIDEEAARQELALRLDCFTSSQLRVLTGITENTEQAWRKRGSGPSYILAGREYLYPRKAVSEWLARRMRDQASGPAKDLL